MEEILNEHIENKAAGKKGNGEFGDEDLVDVFLRVKENAELQFPITNDHIKAVIFVSLLRTLAMIIIFSTHFLSTTWYQSQVHSNLL